ncbi:MAG: hypothetical protein R3E66_09705 [bacterium]
MLVYLMLLLVATTLLTISGVMGIIYCFVSSVILGAGFVYFCVKTAFDDSEAQPWAKRTFAYSIIYLALLFGAMSLDSVSTLHFTERNYIMSIEHEADKIRSRQTLEELQKIHNEDSAPQIPGTEITDAERNTP